MTTPRVWTFTPLGSTGSGVPLTLSGWQAPFGRARQGGILNAGQSIRRTTTYYPGKNAQPTVHAFGTVLKPFEIHGRWMDQAIGTQGGALQLKQQFQALIDEEQIVRAQWGELLSYKIFLHDFDAEIEDEATVVWQLHADTLQDESKPVITRDIPAKNPSDLAGEIQAQLKTGNPYTADSYPSLRGILGQVTDTLDLLVGVINQPAADIFSICAAISDFESAVSSDLGKLTASVQLLRSSVIELRDTNEFIAAQAVENELEVEAQFQQGLFSAPDWINMTADNINADAADVSLLAIITDVQNQIDLTQRGQAAAAVTGQGGGSFESMSRQAYGSAGGARAIKDANAVRYGQRPIAGKVYSLPKRAG